MTFIVRESRRWENRRGTAAALAARNEVLLDGEICVETDTGRFKIGDGATAYNSLPYANVNINGDAPDDGDVLTYNASLGLWRPEAAAGGAAPDTTISRIWELMDGFTTSTATGTSFVTNAALPVAYLGSGTAAYQVEAGRPGMVRLGTGTSSSGYARMFYTPGLPVKFGGGVIRFRQPIRIPTLSTGTQRFNLLIGFANVINGAGLQRLQALYEDDLNGGQWMLRATDGSGTTDANSTIAPVAGATSNIEIQVNAAATSASLYVDGVLAATVAANIPTVAMGPGAWITKAVGTTAVHLDLLGYAEYEETVTTPR